MKCKSVFSPRGPSATLQPVGPPCILIYHHFFRCHPVCSASFFTAVCLPAFISQNTPPHTPLIPPLLCSLSSLRHVPSSNRLSDCPDSFFFFGLPFLSCYFFSFFNPSPLFCCIRVSGFSLIVSLHVSLTPSRFLPLPPPSVCLLLSLYLCLSLCHLDALPPPPAADVRRPPSVEWRDFKI